jgi:hypothetical protein
MTMNFLHKTESFYSSVSPVEISPRKFPLFWLDNKMNFYEEEYRKKCCARIRGKSQKLMIEEE